MSVFEVSEFEVFFHGNKIIVEATSLWEAKQKAIVLLKVRKKDEGLIAIQLKGSTDFMYN